MAGGGHIIIRGSVAHTAALSVVQDNISAEWLTQLQTILAQPVANWSDENFYFVQCCVNVAYANVS
jgi:hypothetical protein